MLEADIDILHMILKNLLQVKRICISHWTSSKTHNVQWICEIGVPFNVKTTSTQVSSSWVTDGRKRKGNARDVVGG